MILGQLLRAYLKEHEISQRQAAKLIGIKTPSTLWRFLNGENVDGETLAKIVVWTLGKEQK